MITIILPRKKPDLSWIAIELILFDHTGIKMTSEHI